MRLRDLKRKLKPYGIAIEPGGRHYHAEKPGFGPFPIPAHNGDDSEITKIYLKALCRHFRIDFKELIASTK